MKNIADLEKKARLARILTEEIGRREKVKKSATTLLRIVGARKTVKAADARNLLKRAMDLKSMGKSAMGMDRCYRRCCWWWYSRRPHVR